MRVSGEAVAEVELRAHGEAVAEQRRRLPLGGRLGADYRFQQWRDGAPEDIAFAELFGEHSSLILYTMMFGPEWDAPCPSCTSIVDAMNANWYVVSSSSAIAVVSAASAKQLVDWAETRGWTIPLYSGGESSYVTDYAGFETDDPSVVSCMNVFRRTDDGIFHTWASELLSRPMDSGHPRHVDAIWPMWNLLDMTPQGRGDAIIPQQDFRHEYFTRHILPQGPDEDACC